MSYVDNSNLTPDLDLQLLQEGNSPHPWFDRAIMILDGFIMPAVEDKDILTPPVSPTAGQMWLIDGVGATDTEWEQHTDKFALYYPQFDTPTIRDNWIFMPIKNGQTIWIKDENILATRKSGSWVTFFPITDPTDLPRLITTLNQALAALRGHGILDG